MDRAARVAGGLWGLLVGDALGVPYEFHAASSLPPLAEIELTPPKGFSRAHAGVPPGTWSDDGAQALCLLESLLECGKLDAEDLGQRFLRWYRRGHLTPDGRVFDVGVQTGQALRALESGTPALAAGRTDERANGNGALMRVLPLALWHRGSDAQLVEDAHLQGLPTHGHARSQVCCALYVLWARRLMDAHAHPLDHAVETLRSLYQTQPIHAAELDGPVLQAQAQGRFTGSGYVVDCLWSAWHALQQPTFEGVVKHAVALGNDTDTTACVAGGLAGIRDGVDVIPARWMQGMAGRHVVEPLLQRLLRT